jgi:hypothetical protein
VELLARGADKAIELDAVGPLDPLLELRVDVHRHLRVGVPDLAHDPLDVEVVRQQRDRDVRAAEAVGRGAGERRQTACLQAPRGEAGSLSVALATACLP